jgi:hypothetical protein
MAYLSDQDRQRVRVGLCRRWSRLWEFFGNLTTAELRDAVNATDAWIEDNQVSYNSSLPNPAKTELSQVQKTVLFCAVASMRVSLDFLRALFGEVD